MARARNIKPGFFTNDDLAEIAPLGRLLFAGLWTLADREGRLEDRPKKIKAEVLPFDNCNIEKLLADLAKFQFIQRYSVNGQDFIQVTKWKKHQNPHVKEAASTIPAPGEHSASTVQSPVQAPENPERAGLIPDSGFLIPDSPIQSSSGNSTQPECATLVDLGDFPADKRDDDRLPPRPKSMPVDPGMRAVAIATLLTGAGVKKVTAFHPDVAVTWAQDERVTDAMLLAAVARAKESLGEEPFQVAYLRPIVVELLSPPAPKAAKERDDWAWKRSNPGIDAKGRELGMFARGGESYNDFAARIQAKLDERKGQKP